MLTDQRESVQLDNCIGNNHPLTTSTDRSRADEIRKYKCLGPMQFLHTKQKLEGHKNKEPTDRQLASVLSYTDNHETDQKKADNPSKINQNA